MSLCCLDCRVTKGVMYFEERGFWSCFCIFSVPRKDGGFISRKDEVVGMRFFRVCKDGGFISHKD